MSKTKIRNHFAGSLLSVSSGFFYAISYAMAKFITDVSRAELAFLRYLGIALLAIPILAESGEPFFGPSSWSFRFWIFLRATFGASALLFKYHAMEHISLANATIIRQSAPIFVFLFARILLKESFSRYHAISLILSTLGIGLASKLHLLAFGQTEVVVLGNVTNTLMNQGNVTNVVTGSEPETYHILIGNLYAILSTISAALVCIALRKMAKVHHSVVIFVFSFIAMIEMAPISMYIDDFTIPTDGYVAYLIVGLGLFSFYSQIVLTKAFHYEEAGVVAIIKDSSETIFSFICEMIIFGVKPDVFSILGALMVTFAVMLLSFRNYVISLPETDKHRKRFKILTY